MKLFGSHLVAAMVAPLVAEAGYHHPHNDVLKHGSPESVGMLSKPLKQMVDNITAYTEVRNWGSSSHNKSTSIEPGGVTLVAHDGVIVSHFAMGHRNLWASVDGYEGVKLPLKKRELVTKDTIYDMASLTKMFTTVAALRCIDKGLFTVDGKVSKWLPAFAKNGKENVTVLQLATHTSGFEPDPMPGLYSDKYPTYESRIKGILNYGLENKPGEKFVYSDLNFMSLMLLIEKVTHKKLDEVICEYTEPLGMRDTFFNRGNIEGPALKDYDRIAAQEFQIAVLGKGEPKRPQPVRGSVHDENAWSLDGVSGHAGLFSTVLDTAKFCQMILNNGTYGGRRYLSKKSVDLIFTNFNERFGEGYEHGFGFELNQYYTAGPMANLLSASHTGYTGTTLVADRASNTVVLHFANRVHPSREWSSNNIVRETVGAWVATSLGRDVEFPSP